MSSGTSAPTDSTTETVTAPTVLCTRLADHTAPHSAYVFSIHTGDVGGRFLLKIILRISRDRPR